MPNSRITESPSLKGPHPASACCRNSLRNVTSRWSGSLHPNVPWWRAPHGDEAFLPQHPLLSFLFGTRDPPGLFSQSGVLRAPVLSTHSVRGPKPSMAVSLDMAVFSLLWLLSSQESGEDCTSSSPHISPHIFIETASEEVFVTLPYPVLLSG